LADRIGMGIARKIIINKIKIILDMIIAVCYNSIKKWLWLFHTDLVTVEYSFNLYDKESHVYGTVIANAKVVPPFLRESCRGYPPTWF